LLIEGQWVQFLLPRTVLPAQVPTNTAGWQGRSQPAPLCFGSSRPDSGAAGTQLSGWGDAATCRTLLSSWDPAENTRVPKGDAALPPSSWLALPLRRRRAVGKGRVLREPWVRARAGARRDLGVPWRCLTCRTGSLRAAVTGQTPPTRFTSTGFTALLPALVMPPSQGLSLVPGRVGL